MSQWTKAHLRHPQKTEISLFDVKRSVAIASHEEVCCNEYADRVVYPRDLRCIIIVIDEDGDCGKSSVWSEPQTLKRATVNKLTLHPTLPLVGLLSIQES